MACEGRRNALQPYVTAVVDDTLRGNLIPEQLDRTWASCHERRLNFDPRTQAAFRPFAAVAEQVLEHAAWTAMLMFFSDKDMLC